LINAVWVYFKVYKKLNVSQNLKSIKEI